jgi:hypothetical protein
MRMIDLKVMLELSGTKERLTEEIHVSGNARTALWLRAFPSRPKVRIAEEILFSNLETLTALSVPHNEQLRGSLFGPSVVTLLTHKLAPAIGESPKKKEPPVEPDRSLNIATFNFFEGAVPTSTITHRPIFPDSLTSLLRTESVSLDIGTELTVAHLLNDGWVVVIAALRDDRPASPAPAKIGPLIWEFESPKPLYPVQFEQAANPRHGRFFLVGDEPLVPRSHRLVWDDRPWDDGDRASGTYYVGYNHPISEDGPLHFEISERAGFPLTSSSNLLRLDIDTGSFEQGELTFSPAQHASLLPGRGSRGGSLDMLLTVLLGLTPLLYTPESWFLLWWAARARARARASRDASLIGLRLWSLYAIAVGAYWFGVLEGAGRVAAIIPALVGLVQLALPYVEREPTPIRAKIPKKKKA